GQTYYVIKVSKDEIKLADSYLHAVGQPFVAGSASDHSDDILAVAVTPLTLTNVGSDGGQHSLSRNLKNLQDGVTYYVVNSDQTAGTFQLAATRGGAAIAIDNGDSVQILQRNGAVAQTIHPITRGGTHRVGTEAIDLQPGSGTQQLYLDLSAQPIV